MAFLWRGQLYQDCFQIYISKLFGVSIMLLSSILKVPQIKNIVKNGSVEGLNAFSISCELIVYYFSSLYAIYSGIPFSLYGENILIFIQCFIILILFWKYSNHFNCSLNILSRLFVVISLIGFAYLCNYENGAKIPNCGWIIIRSLSIPIFSIGRFSMIYNCFVKKSTNSIYLLDYLLNFVINLTRLFTLYSETKEYLLMFTMFYTSILNFTICTIILCFRNKKVFNKEKIYQVKNY